MNDQISGQTDVTGATLQGHQDAPPLDPGMVCMSVVEDGPRIAFAAYNEDLNCIIVEYAVVDGYETQDIVERVLSVIRPTLILISNKIVANDNLLELLTTPPIQLAQGTKNAKDPLDTNEAAHGLSQSIDDSGLAQPSPTRRRSIPYRMMKTASFDIRNSKTIITQKLRVRSLMRQLYKDLGRGVAGQQANRHFPLTVDQPQNRSLGVSAYHALASIIDFDSNVQVQALGSLLSFLHTTVFRLEQGGFITVNDLVPAKASLYMTISPTTLSTLHIFNTEHHPLAAAKGASNSKEGFSLFSLLDRTKSRTGRQRLRDWMLKPLLDVDAIRLRQDGVELFMQEDLQVAVGSILNLLGKVGAVDKILVRIQKCCAKPNDFLVLTRSLAAGIAICGNLQQDILWNLQRISVGHTTDDETAPCINEPPSIEEARVETAVLRYLNFVASILRNCHIDIIHEIHERITSIVDEELTSECQSVVIRVGFHERLDIYKRQYDGLDEIMKDVATALGDQYPLLRDVLKVMFMPQVGFLVALPPSPQWMENGALPDDFEYVFSESLSYFKSAEMRQLDQNIGDLDAFIKDAETLIVAELEDEILDHESELRETFIALAELDCILSFAGAAADLDFVRPRVVSASEQCVEISRGRHPLQEIVLDTAFVPNDTTMNTTSRVTVITGPNFSGKSCFARQVGVLVYMAHIGCFLPCDEARISLTDQIFTQFSSTETCAVPQSSFQLDLSRMGAILRRASQHSLVLIDEFGKGTSPASGISLLTAALQKLVSNRSKVICTTHFLEIFSIGLLVDSENGISAMHMTVHVPETANDSAVPLFRMEHGIANSSAGLVCAKMAGVKKAIVDRAYEIIKAIKKRQKVHPLAELLRNDIHMTLDSKHAIRSFVSTSWRDASDDQIDAFFSITERM